MTLYDHFELPELSKYHMLKRQVRYYGSTSNRTDESNIEIKQL